MGFLILLGIVFVGSFVLGIVIDSSSKKQGSSDASGEDQSSQSWLGSSSGSGHSHSNHCDGNCNNCPAHYGYRYGRWYYGHGHQHGCERGGNGGATGRTNRD